MSINFNIKIIREEIKPQPAMSRYRSYEEQQINSNFDEFENQQPIMRKHESSSYGKSKTQVCIYFNFNKIG